MFAIKCFETDAVTGRGLVVFFSPNHSLSPHSHFILTPFSISRPLLNHKIIFFCSENSFLRISEIPKLPRIEPKNIILIIKREINKRRTNVYVRFEWKTEDLEKEKERKGELVSPKNLNSDWIASQLHSRTINEDQRRLKSKSSRKIQEENRVKFRSKKNGEKRSKNFH